MQKYDPNAAASADDGIYGLPCTFEDASVVYVPIPWEATTSYGAGTAHGPQAILNASPQMDVFDVDVHNPYESGLFCLPIPAHISDLNVRAKILAKPIKAAGGDIADDHALHSNLKAVNHASIEVNEWVRKQTQTILSQNKIPGLIGGDHSCPFGAFQAAAEKYKSFGILHFDAHSDTRDAYLGFEFSHASIMHNAATKIPEIKKFVQVGIRDFCEAEVEFTKQQKDRFTVFYDHDLQASKIRGETFQTIAEKIIAPLPDLVWVSFDIDGLDPRYCPHTGTPVPGGLDYAEAVHILRLLSKSGRKIIGFDLMEVAPPLSSDGSPVLAEHAPQRAAAEWDANVGMRLLYKLTALALRSQARA